MQSRRVRQHQAQRLARFTSQLSAAFEAEAQSLAAAMNSYPPVPVLSEEDLLSRLNSLDYCCQCYRSHVSCPVAVSLPARQHQQQQQEQCQQQQEGGDEQHQQQRRVGGDQPQAGGHRQRSC